MNASKENARQALQNLQDVLAGQDELCALHAGKILFLQDFLHAATTKLPAEAAYKKEKERRKKGDGT